MNTPISIIPNHNRTIFDVCDEAKALSVATCQHTNIHERHIISPQPGRTEATCNPFQLSDYDTKMWRDGQAEFTSIENTILIGRDWGSGGRMMCIRIQHDSKIEINFIYVNYLKLYSSLCSLLYKCLFLRKFSSSTRA